MTENIDREFNVPENVQLYVMQASDDLMTATINDNNANISLALSLTQVLSNIATAEIDTVQDMQEGTYSGWMDNNDSKNDPGLYTGDSDDISVTTSLIAQAQSVFSAQQNTANSMLQNLTQHVHLSMSALQKLEQFMQAVLGTTGYVSNLVAQPL